MNRKKQYFRVLIAFCSLLILIFFNTCKKIELTREALVQTGSSNVRSGVVDLTGTIIDLGEGITDHGFIVSNTPGSSAGSMISKGGVSQTGQFSHSFSGAASGENYYFMAFATSGGEIIYGESNSFSTPALVVTTQTASILSKSSTTLYGGINNLGFESVTDHGFYWATDPTPQNVAQNRVSLGTATDASTFNYTLTDLVPYTNYYFVAFAQNDSETKFGSVQSFKIENIWTQIGNFGGDARYRALAFSLEETGYITGGYDAGDINDFYQFSPDPENWTLLSSGTSPVDGATFTIGNKAYVISWNNLYEFNPDYGIWIPKTPFPGTGRNGFFVFSIGNRGFVGGGSYWDGNQDVYFNDLWEFDPQDDLNGTDINGDPMGSWVQKTNFPGTGRRYGEGFSIGIYGYVCCGSNNNNGDLNDLWQYAPFSTDNGFDSNGNPMGTWVQKGQYPGIPGTAQTNFIIQNKAYIFKDTELWQFDPFTENWEQMADFPGQPRFVPVGFAINNKGYVGTGVYDDEGTNVYLNDFWEYLPPQEGKK